MNPNIYKAFLCRVKCLSQLPNGYMLHWFSISLQLIWIFSIAQVATSFMIIYNISFPLLPFLITPLQDINISHQGLVLMPEVILLWGGLEKGYKHSFSVWGERLPHRQSRMQTESRQNPDGILKYDGVKVMHSISQQIWKMQQWPQDWKRSVAIPIPKAMPKSV